MFSVSPLSPPPLRGQKSQITRWKRKMIKREVKKEHIPVPAGSFHLQQVTIREGRENLLSVQVLYVTEFWISKLLMEEACIKWVPPETCLIFYPEAREEQSPRDRLKGAGEAECWFMITRRGPACSRRWLPQVHTEDSAALFDQER